MTRISNHDFEMAKQYLEDPNGFDLTELTEKSELLRNYHNAGDNAGNTEIESIKKNYNLILNVISIQ